MALEERNAGQMQKEKEVAVANADLKKREERRVSAKSAEQRQGLHGGSRRTIFVRVQKVCCAWIEERRRQGSGGMRKHKDVFKGRG